MLAAYIKRVHYIRKTFFSQYSEHLLKRHTTELKSDNVRKNVHVGNTSVMYVSECRPIHHIMRVNVDHRSMRGNVDQYITVKLE